MVLDDIFERFAQQSPVTVMVRAALEHALSPQAIDALFEQTAERQYTRTLLFSSVVDLMGTVVARIQPAVNAAYQARAEALGVSLKAVYDKLDRTGAGPVRRAGPPHRPHPRPGHHRHGRRAGGLAAGLSDQDPRRQPPGRHRAPAQGAAHHRGRGPAGPGPGRARPAGDAGHRRVPLRGRPRPGAIAPGLGAGDDPARRRVDRRPQLLHDRLPLRHRPAGRSLRDPPARGHPLHRVRWASGGPAGGPRPGRCSSRRCGSATATAGRWWCGGSPSSWTRRPATARPRSTS